MNKYNTIPFQNELSNLGISLSELQLQQFLTYYELLIEKNKVMNLTAITDFDEVIEKRLPNPFMPDTPQRIATDTSQKLSIRFGETVKAYLANPELDVKTLKILPMVFALWLRYLLGIDDNGKEFELSPDPLLPDVKNELAGIVIGKNDEFEVEEKIKKLLKNEKIFGFDVVSSELYGKVKSYFMEMISANGKVREVISRAVEN